MARLIIALDLGTSCGWAVVSVPDGGKPKREASGTWRLLGGGDRHPGLRWMRLHEQLRHLVARYDPDGTRGVELVYEDVRRHAGTRAAHVYGGLRAVVELAALALDVTPRGIPVGTWKKLACGKGSASKDEYVDAMNKRWRLRMTVKKREDEAAALGVATAALRMPALDVDKEIDR